MRESPGYRPQLDGLRAVAIGLVLLDHGSPRDVWICEQWVGDAGVRLFFVLSGFLITRLLLRARESALASGSSLWSAAWRFHARRALRIMPAYYALIGLLYLAGQAAVRLHPGVFCGYVANWWLAADPARSAYALPVCHLWSLSVEEQFYVLWPALVLFLSRGFALRAVGASIVVALAWRAGVLYVEADGAPNALLIHRATPGCLDGLGIGALLAFAPGHWLWRGGPAALALAGNVALRAIGGAAYHVLGDVALGIAFAHAVARADMGAWPALGARPLVALGRISYGVYLFHLPALWALVGVARAGGYSLSGLFESRGVADGLLLALVGILAARVSWRLLEEPVSRLKGLLT